MLTDKKVTQQLMFPVYFRILASESLNCNNSNFVKLCDDVITNLTKNKNRAKIVKRTTRECTKYVNYFQDKQENKFYGHKMILILNHLMQLLINNNFKFDQEVINLAELFFEIESNQNVTDEDWLKLKKSAEKSAEKMFKELINDLFKE